jgi:hypothetical protein
MKKAYMIAECMGDSIYEAHTIPFVYLKREWAEYQLSVLENESDNALYSAVKYKIREVQLVEQGPE